MKRVVVALVVAVGAGVVNADASGNTTLYATPNGGSVVGQAVTFTASFVFGCADGIPQDAHYFIVDGKAVSGQFVQHGQNGTETLVVRSFAAGRHAVSYKWSTSTPGGSPCEGGASIFYTVRPRPAPPSPQPTPSPSPSPPPSASASPSPPFAGVVSSTRIELAATAPASASSYGYLAGALIALALWAGAGLILLARGRAP